MNGAAADARFNSIMAACLDGVGSLVIADCDNNAIRFFNSAKGVPTSRVSLSTCPGVGEVTTLAGTGKAGFADGACDKAQFEGPNGLVCTPDGLIYVADTVGHRIRCIDRKTRWDPLESTCRHASLSIL